MPQYPPPQKYPTHTVLLMQSQAASNKHKAQDREIRVAQAPMRMDETPLYWVQCNGLKSAYWGVDGEPYSKRYGYLDMSTLTPIE